MGVRNPKISKKSMLPLSICDWQWLKICYNSRYFCRHSLPLCESRVNPTKQTTITVNNRGEALSTCLTTKTLRFSCQTETRKVHDVRGEIQRAFGLRFSSHHYKPSFQGFLDESEWIWTFYSPNSWNQIIYINFLMIQIPDKSLKREDLAVLHRFDPAISKTAFLGPCSPELFRFQFRVYAFQKWRMFFGDLFGWFCFLGWTLCPVHCDTQPNGCFKKHHSLVHPLCGHNTWKPGRGFNLNKKRKLHPFCKDIKIKCSKTTHNTLENHQPQTEPQIQQEISRASPRGTQSNHW